MLSFYTFLSIIHMSDILLSKLVLSITYVICVHFMCSKCMCIYGYPQVNRNILLLVIEFFLLKLNPSSTIG